MTELSPLRVQCAIAERDELMEKQAQLQKDMKAKADVIESFEKERYDQDRAVQTLMEQVEQQCNHIRDLQAALEDGFLNVEREDLSDNEELNVHL